MTMRAYLLENHFNKQYRRWIEDQRAERTAITIKGRNMLRGFCHSPEERRQQPEQQQKRMNEGLSA